jgi:dipeptidyl aminopeptidase/acylaminoacyl peptidase
MPQWSPRGRAVTFHSVQTGKGYSEIYTIGPWNAQPTKLTRDKLGKGTPIWSPDGSWIFYSGQQPAAEGQESAWQIWRIPSRGGESVVLAERGQVPLGVDDQFVYFHRSSGEFDRGQIWRVSHLGGEATLVLAESIYCWEWTIWRNQLVYVNRFLPEGPAIESFDLDTKRILRIGALEPKSFDAIPSMETDAFLWGGLTVSPDGQWILYGKPNVSEADLMIMEAGP